MSASAQNAVTNITKKMENDNEQIKHLVELIDDDYGHGGSTIIHIKYISGSKSLSNEAVKVWNSRKSKRKVRQTIPHKKPTTTVTAQY